ncbi:calcium-binding EGF domain protein [Gregarina niphandrodes]|uniref:Calcium-binding EGF domain protein n=1 Tax=Gregarina niphandrodes TaxID=110365 RepID=A0A023B267_GRENI|nr:calcium-binding EGF domain protein [Gregarina niphandrodes]EZG48586.1 calcium-binding EGF domain protein [Gregarina niphandrodes]|eukprot:XP_011132090.1 calcium-binding EGF domain protein [Gregarina niphandrodes]
MGLPLVGDLCKRDNPCVDSATCIIDPAAPIIGRPFCICPQGFSGDGRKDGDGCHDIDECMEHAHSCLPESERCFNTYGAYECHCKSGYAKRPGDQHCRDINECLDESICGDKGATCVNLPGSFTCACSDPRQEYSNGRCVIKDFCADPDYNNCDKNYGVCINGVDGAECLCREGFQLADDGVSCVDIDECRTGDHNCPLDISECVNEKGSYRCECSEKKGWTNSGSYECVNLNECEVYPDVCGPGFDCCRDLPPPRKYLCSEVLMGFEDPDEVAVEGVPSLLNPLAMMNFGANQVRKFVHKTTEEFLPNIFPATGYRNLRVTPEMALEQSLSMLPEQYEYFAGSMPRRLGGMADQMVKYTVEAATHIVPALAPNHDKGTCPFGFVDLRPIKRRAALKKVPEASSKLFSWIKENSPIKLYDVENVEPAAVAVGLAHNAKNLFDQMSEWYKALSAVPAALEGHADQVTGRINIQKDMDHLVSLVGKASQPFKEAINTVKAWIPEDRAGSSDLTGLPVAV